MGPVAPSVPPAADPGGARKARIGTARLRSGRRVRTRSGAPLIAVMPANPIGRAPIQIVPAQQAISEHSLGRRASRPVIYAGRIAIRGRRGSARAPIRVHGQGRGRIPNAAQVDATDRAPNGRIRSNPSGVPADLPGRPTTARSHCHLRCRSARRSPATSTDLLGAAAAPVNQVLLDAPTGPQTNGLDRGIGRSARVRVPPGRGRLSRASGVRSAPGTALPFPPPSNWVPMRNLSLVAVRSKKRSRPAGRRDDCS